MYVHFPLPPLFCACWRRVQGPGVMTGMAEAGKELCDVAVRSYQ